MGIVILGVPHVHFSQLPTDADANKRYVPNEIVPCLPLRDPGLLASTEK